MSVTERTPLVHDSPTVLSLLILVSSLPLPATLRYGASVTERTTLVQDSPTPPYFTRYPQIWCISS